MISCCFGCGDGRVCAPQRVRLKPTETEKWPQCFGLLRSSSSLSLWGANKAHAIAAFRRQVKTESRRWGYSLQLTSWVRATISDLRTHVSTSIIAKLALHHLLLVLSMRAVAAKASRRYARMDSDSPTRRVHKRSRPFLDIAFVFAAADRHFWAFDSWDPKENNRVRQFGRDVSMMVRSGNALHATPFCFPFSGIIPR